MTLPSDGVDSDLQRGLSRSKRIDRTRALLLVLPLAVFLTFSFFAPIGSILVRAVWQPEVAQLLPNTKLALEDWSAAVGLPDNEVFLAFSAELKAAAEQRLQGRIGSKLNAEKSGMRSLVTRTARILVEIDDPQGRDFFVAHDLRWGDVATWSVIKRATATVTTSHILNAVDLRFDEFGNVEAMPDDLSVHATLFGRTVVMSVLITVLCLALGYPLAYVLAAMPTKRANLLMILVLLPFWTSLLVRTTAWIVILQSQGVLNSGLSALGIVDLQDPPQLIYNQLGTIITMTHVLLPFMVLPLYATMRSIPPSLTRAGLSLGARPFTAFRTIFLPLTMPGVGAGGILVFIIALGYYITPALVGGESGQMISSTIAFHMTTTLNWELASALGAILLLGVLALYMFYSKLQGSENIALGGAGSVEAMPPMSPNAEPIDRFGSRVLRVLAGGILAFLVLPVLVVIPLSFNVESFFTFTPGMLQLDPEAYSLKWYRSFMSNPLWGSAFVNSFVIAVASTVIAVVLGTLASAGLVRLSGSLRSGLTAVLIAPMIVPIIIAGAGMYMFFSSVGITEGKVALILAHSALGVPFVVITVSAALSSFDQSLFRAAIMGGATPFVAFRTVVLPLIAPGMISGALFAFSASFDEIVVAIFLAPDPGDFTVPRMLWSGVRQDVSPVILAVATVLVLLAIAMLTTAETMRRRSERLQTADC